MEELEGMELGEDRSGGGKWKVRGPGKLPDAVVAWTVIVTAVVVVLLVIMVVVLDVGLTERVEVLRNVTVSEMVTLGDKVQKVEESTNSAVGKLDSRIGDVSSRVIAMNTVVGEIRGRVTGLSGELAGWAEVLAELVAVREEMAALRAELVSLNLTSQVP